jgi:hypothetical protein
VGCLLICLYAIIDTSLPESIKKIDSVRVVTILPYTVNGKVRERLKFARESRGLTRHQLERMASLGSGHVRRLELDESFSPTLETLERVKRALRIELPWLLTGRGALEEGPLTSVLRAKPFSGQWVYFIGLPGKGHIKIGFTSNVGARLAHFKKTLGLVMRQLLMLEGGRNLEKLLLELFHEFRIEGEWFEPAPQLLAFIEAFKKKADGEE